MNGKQAKWILIIGIVANCAVLLFLSYLPEPLDGFISFIAVLAAFSAAFLVLKRFKTK